MKIAIPRDRRLMLIDGRAFTRRAGMRSNTCGSCHLLRVWISLSVSDQDVVYRAYCSACARNHCRDGGWKEVT